MLRIPINHFEGNYTCSPEMLDRLRAEDQIVLRYVDNPNGSVDDIAGICNEAGNVVGLMPHPERAVSRAAGLGPTALPAAAHRCWPTGATRPIGVGARQSIRVRVSHPG